MKFLVRRRPSASMMVAILALVVAASGTAVAGVRLVAGDNLIKPRSLSGNRLRNHSVTGTQVAAGTLGQVQSAKNADHAVVAGSAENAVNAQDAFSAANAVNATNANNAGTVGGQPPSSFLAASTRVGTGGLVRVAAGSTVTLFTFGPFTVRTTCTSSSVQTTVTSSEPGSVVDSQGQISAHLDRASTGSGSASGIDFDAPDGTEAIFSAADGVNTLGSSGCWANWVGMR